MYFLLWRSTTTTIPQRNSSALLPSEMKEIRVQTKFPLHLPLFISWLCLKDQHLKPSVQSTRVQHRKSSFPTERWRSALLLSFRVSTFSPRLVRGNRDPHWGRKGRETEGKETKKQLWEAIGHLLNCTRALTEKCIQLGSWVETLLFVIGWFQVKHGLKRLNSKQTFVLKWCW